MKKIFLSLPVLFLGIRLLTSCSGTPAPVAESKAPLTEGLMSLDAAITGTVVEVEKWVQQGTEITITTIDAPLSALSEFLHDELFDRFGARKIFLVLARGQGLEYLNEEHTYQMSGMVDDESAVGIGHYLGAKVVITGTFDQFGNFSQLRIRAIDVLTGALLATYSARIRNDDPILAGVTQPLQKQEAVVITEDALTYLNRGRDYFAERKYDKAREELDKALMVNLELIEAYFYRGFAYGWKQNYDRAISDYTEVLKRNPDHIPSIYNRGLMYTAKQEYDKAIADFVMVLNSNPSDVLTLNNRGLAYTERGVEFAQKKDATRAKSDYELAIADFTKALDLNPQNIFAFYNRGNVYYYKQDYDQAIADYTAALAINPKIAEVLNNRGMAYMAKNNYDRAIADFTEARNGDPLNERYRDNLQLAQNAKAGKK